MKAGKAKKFTVFQWINLFKNGGKFYHLADLMKLSGLGYFAARKAAQKLVRENILIKLYPEFFANGFSTPQAEEVANVVYPPSYISCETALFHHGIIDQAPFVIVSVSTRKSRRIRIGDNHFLYHRIKNSLFWGYTQELGYLMAEPEKALLDWLYLNPKKHVQFLLDEVNWDMLNAEKVKKYSRSFPEYVGKILGTHIQ